MELEIVRIMQQSAGTPFSYKEIGKMVDRAEFRNNPHWARPILEKLVFERQIWKDGVYYVYPTGEQKEERRRNDRVKSSTFKS